MTTLAEFNAQSPEGLASYRASLTFVREQAATMGWTPPPATVTFAIGEHDAERLSFILEVMKRVVEEERTFNIASWYDMADSVLAHFAEKDNLAEQELHACGTSACVLGWVASTEEWRASGGTNSQGVIALGGKRREEALELWLKNQVLAELIVFPSAGLHIQVAKQALPSVVEFCTKLHDALIPEYGSHRDQTIKSMIGNCGMSIYGPHSGPIAPKANEVADVLERIIETQQITCYVEWATKSQDQVLKSMSYDIVDRTL